uniref:FspI n=1 Tax=Fischerella muscicola SAG 1427-1 = PCC 73103 TaxID=372781 RepID=F1KC58_FISMU|nr:FspI [Fischerella muscicola SAG 1427-1 = PCC 73103]
MLTNNEIERLRQAIIATIASPVIGSIEDYTWEAIFHYVKDIPLSDPALGRSKLLYDAVDVVTKTGWSLKSLQLKSLNFKSPFLFVIQRADILKKSVQLGFPGLTEQSSPDELGAAIIQHWNEKIILSQAAQSVVNSYEGILLKTIKGYEYIYCEFPLDPLDPSTFSWAWTVDKTTGGAGVGLQGSIVGKTELVWYKNQKQLFRARTIPAQAVRITVERTRLTLDRYVKTVIFALQDQINMQFSENEPEE